MYRLCTDIHGKARYDMIRRIDDGTCIPADPQNRDWKIYQEWLAAGNKPLPPESGHGLDK